MKECKKCKGKRNYFKKLYDTALGGYKVVRNKKGKIGKWVMCPKCLGTGRSE